jgi:acetyl esterase/lipase
MTLSVLMTSLIVLVAGAQSVSPPALLKQEVAQADHRLHYAPGELHFGELRLPKTGKSPYPVVMLVHGGCWANELPRLDRRGVSLDLLRPMAAALADAGIATWNVEYRRAGDPGGGWPGSFEDVAKATDYLRELAGKHALDLTRVVVAGHSSGGHLAAWIAARPKLPSSSPVHSKDPLPVKAVVILDGIADPAAFQPMETKVCGMPALSRFLGGTPTEFPERYRDASPVPFLPLGVPQEFIAGSLVRGLKDQIDAYQSAARAKGDSVTITALAGAGHFDMLAPPSPHWASVLARFQAVLAQPVGGAAADRDAVLAAVQKFFDTMTSKNVEEAKRVLMADGRFVSVRDDRPEPRSSTIQSYLDGLATRKQDYRERMWEPEVRIHGAIATVWTRYDFWVDGKFSHCGVDAFDLVKTLEGWKISGGVYTVERTGCPPSPLGPLK